MAGEGKDRPQPDESDKNEDENPAQNDAPEEGSVTRPLGHFKDGDDDALRYLMDRYREQLIGLSEKKIRAAGGGIPVGDGEDVANSVFLLLWQGVRNQKFPNLNNRQQLWNLLSKMASDTVIDRIRSRRAKKRGEGKVRNESDWLDPEERAWLDGILREQPSVEEISMFEEELGRYLAMVKNPVLRQIAELDIQGYTDQEIADRVGIAKRTVALKLELIRKVWRSGDGRRDEPPAP